MFGVIYTVHVYSYALVWSVKSSSKHFFLMVQLTYLAIIISSNLPSLIQFFPLKSSLL